MFSSMVTHGFDIYNTETQITTEDKSMFYTSRKSNVSVKRVVTHDLWNPPPCAPLPFPLGQPFPPHLNYYSLQHLLLAIPLQTRTFHQCL